MESSRFLNSQSCACEQQTHSPRLIVLTGGPGAGKTAILELARKYFCPHVSILPESAGIIFSGGFPRGDSLPARLGRQRAIFSVQSQLERILIEEKVAAVGLCDRGTLDGLAYWPEDHQSFFRQLGTSLEVELAKYHAIIHLKTPSQLGGYNHSNPYRTETPEQAKEIDGKILKAWEGHPRRTVIESETEFFEKARQALDVLASFIPQCCRMSLEN